jgi:hypothetical protein
VTEQDHTQLQNPQPPMDPLQTGNAVVDEALLGLADLTSAPLPEHHDRLAKAHEVLQDTLDRGDGDRSGDAAPG